MYVYSRVLLSLFIFLQLLTEEQAFQCAEGTREEAKGDKWTEQMSQSFT